MPSKKVTIVLAGLAFCLAVWASFYFLIRSETKDYQSELANAEAGPHEKISDSCSKLAQELTSENLTPLEKNELWEKEYENKVFKWNLQVISAEDFMGEYLVIFKCLPSGERPALVNLLFNKKPQAPEFKAGETHEINGLMIEFDLPPPDWNRNS